MKAPRICLHIEQKRKRGFSTYHQLEEQMVVSHLGVPPHDPLAV